MNDPIRPHDGGISDYIRGALDEGQRQQLEIELLQDPQLFEQAQHEALFRHGLQNADLSCRQAPAGWRGWLRPALTGALALSVVALGLRVWQLQHDLEGLRAPTAGVEVVTLLQQRSVASLLESDAPVASLAGPVLIEIDVSMYETGLFDVDLELAHRNRRWKRFPPDERGYVAVYVPAGQTVRGLRLFDAQGQMIREYRFDG